MEADWSVALAAEDPVITVPWAAPGTSTRRFVDLRLCSDLIDEIDEGEKRPALRAALLLLNGSTSRFWTAKCDVWTSSQSDPPYDAYEMDAEPGETVFGTGSYIDMLAHDLALRNSFERQEHWMRAVVDRLRATPAKAARGELVLRPAEVEAVPGFGVTWFVEGCGGTADRAEQRWSDALELALTVIMEVPLL
jgi:hypothetical protein